MHDHCATVLIADDNPRFVQSIERLIRPLGVRCISDTTSHQVQTLARTLRPDVVLLDVKQNIDGRDLLSRLKSDPETRDIPVIMLTAFDDQHLRRLCLELGAQEYAVKPVDLVFIQRLARLLGQHATLH